MRLSTLIVMCGRYAPQITARGSGRASVDDLSLFLRQAGQGFSVMRRRLPGSPSVAARARRDSPRRTVRICSRQKIGSAGSSAQLVAFLFFEDADYAACSTNLTRPRAWRFLVARAATLCALRDRDAQFIRYRAQRDAARFAILLLGIYSRRFFGAGISLGTPRRSVSFTPPLCP
jgi:hypothetical protein